ncbi:DUF3336 domain-containing protein [Perlucidibaca piscinae]|uniref:DUF3336 domain-containing protein n=1 Tax=Perlucidibaca piscinae TaxID=392589 RepID=UPI0003B3429E|nr:DUF3336 domain-containing protein [Perlucidibaca piscinae]
MVVNKKLAALYRERANATSYQHWRDVSLELDAHTGRDLWKIETSSDDYHHEVLSERLLTLRQWQQAKNHKLLIRALREGLHHDLGNMGNSRLYNQTHVGTKRLIEDYVAQVCDSLNYLCDATIEHLTNDEKLALFEDILRSFGQPALQLSGGATLGMFHIGVCKALDEEGLLPSVISGSSAGSLVASIIGTHTRDELQDFYDGDALYKHAWSWNKLSDGLRGKGFANQKQLETFIRQNIGEFSFEEAFKKTGRHINVSISPIGANQKSRLMNELTSPYLLVWSAVLASCAVPVLFPPVTLTSKSAEGQHRPYMPLERWVDGSMRSDMPRRRLMRLYNVNYFVASQVNPHIVPLLESERRRQEKGAIGSLPKRILKTQSRLLGMGALQVVHDKVSNEALRATLSHAYTMISQSYYGDATIAPRQYTLKHYRHMLQNPTKESIIWFRQQGERATWARIDQIRVQSRISRTLQECVARLLQRRAHNWHEAEVRAILTDREDYLAHHQPAQGKRA